MFLFPPFLRGIDCLEQIWSLSIPNTDPHGVDRVLSMGKFLFSERFIIGFALVREMCCKMKLSIYRKQEDPRGSILEGKKG